MDETFHPTFLPTEPSYGVATSAQQNAWTSGNDASFPVPSASFSSDDISVTSDHAAIAYMRGGTPWADSSLMGALGHTQPPPVQSAPVQTPEPSPSSSPVSACRIGSNTPCTQSLDGRLSSIRRHLSLHGYKHHSKEMVQCPWVGCSDMLRWMNIPRHIRSIHLGIRMVCPTCERSFTRSMGLARHMASKKCSVTRGTSNSIPE